MSPHNPRHNDGFTLAELLVASTILAVILGSVYTAFSSSINIWKKGESNTQTYQDARTALDILSRELQNMVPGASHLFVGTNDEFEFYAVTRPMDVEDGSAPRVLWIRYRTKSDPDGEGKLLIREERTVESPLPSKPPDGGEIDSTIIKHGSESQFELAAGVEDFELQYYWKEQIAGAQFLSDPVQAAFDIPGSGIANLVPAKIIIRSDHEEGTGIPQAIKINLTLIDPNSEKGEAAFTTYAVMHGPTTRLKETSLDAEEYVVQ
ncbi:MAG: prepilin-type N-terminal cleavage/methylation domain-containing protein [Candidatus Hydrogenedentes bacterium]|nr:prepilin-type N-terminal cleavage/methylation domain-containing protein [Candidatus Hydrogenedentota bacterium]